MISPWKHRDNLVLREKHGLISVRGIGVHDGGWTQVEELDLVEARGARGAEKARGVVFDATSEIGCGLLMATSEGFEPRVVGVKF